jgi:TRAP-type C4-dicarboxylate transport system substrate-binding protein
MINTSIYIIEKEDKKMVYKNAFYKLIATSVFLALISIIFFSMPINASGADEPIKLRIAWWNPTRLPPPLDWDPYHVAYNEWCDEIEKAAKGRIKLTRFPGETLLKLPQLWDGIKSRTADLGNVHTPLHPGNFPMTTALQLPGLFPNGLVGCMVSQKLFEEGYMDEELKDVKVLWTMTNSPGDIGSKKKEIRTLEDWKGQRVGVMGEPETSMIKMLGAVPVAIPVTEQYIALDRNAIDACMLEFLGQVVFKFEQVTKYNTAGRLSVRHHYMIMNKDAWNSLPPDIQKIFDEYSGMKAAKRTGVIFDTKNNQAIEYIEKVAKERGNPPIYYPSEKEFTRWRKALEPLYAKVIDDLEAKGLPGKKMIERCRELVKEYSKQ